MKKRKLYLDCDGVILDTINKSYQILKEKNITKDSEINKYYQSIDWKEFLISSGEIDNSISKIKTLSNYFDTKILTHVHSEKEGNAKKEYFKEVLPDIEVIIVPKNIEKRDMVNPKDSVLVDDFSPNLEKWEEKGGIPVKFSNSGKKSTFITITNLLELLEIDFENKE